jgi:CelD/BcsL family acetyltransferase involved in cellulose biosynthesis
LDLVTLRLSGRIVAVAHVLVHRSTALYLTGIDPELERLSLGSLLVAKTMQRAVLRGHTCYDFLRGSEPYKYQFGAHDTFTYRAELPRCNGAVSQ